MHPLVIARYVDAGVTIESGKGSASRRVAAGHSVEERALLAFLDRYFPDRRHRLVPRARERREELIAA